MLSLGAVVHARHVTEKSRGILQTAGPQRQRLIHLRRQRLALFAGFGIEQRLVGGDLDGLLHIADFELQIERLALRDEDLDIGPDQFLEAGFFGCDGPNAGREAWENIKAGLGGNGVRGDSGFLGGRVHRSAWNGGAVQGP